MRVNIFHFTVIQSHLKHAFLKSYVIKFMIIIESCFCQNAFLGAFFVCYPSQRCPYLCVVILYNLGDALVFVFSISMLFIERRMLKVMQSQRRVSFSYCWWLGWNIMNVICFCDITIFIQNDCFYGKKLSWCLTDINHSRCLTDINHSQEISEFLIWNNFYSHELA